MKYDYDDYYFSIEEYIEKNIERLKDEIRDNEDKIYKEKSKGSSSRTIKDLNYTIDKDKEKKRNLDLVEKELHNLMHFSVDPYEMSDELKSRFSEVATFLNEKDLEIFRNTTNNVIGKTADEKQVQIDKYFSRANSAVKKGNLNKTLITVKHKDGNSLDSHMSSMSDTLNNGYKSQKTKIIPKYVWFRGNELKESYLDYSTENRLYYIERLINENRINRNDRRNQKIINEFSNIRKAYETIAMAEEFNFKIDLLEGDLLKDSKLNGHLEPLMNFLKQREKSNNNLIYQTKKYLEKFDFSQIDKEVEEQQKKEQEEKKVNDIETQYLNLNYELEKLSNEHPEEKERINELMEQIRRIEESEKIDLSKMHDLRDQGQRKYHSEIEIQKEEIEHIKYEAKKKYDLEHQGDMALKSAAIDALKKEGKTDAEIVNHPDLIESKVAELRRYAHMSPEARGMEDLIKSGRYPVGTKFEDLSYSEQNNIRVAYSDEADEFIEAVKRQDAREKATKEEKQIVNNVYKEYLKYRASLENKKEYLSFKAFAMKMYQIQNINVDLVDEYTDNIEGYHR